MRRLTAKRLVMMAPSARNNYRKRHNYRINGRTFSPFVPGNQLSKAENLSEEANRKRFLALAQTWKTTVRKNRGERVVTAKTKKRRAASQRARLKETVALEARQIQEISRKSALAVMNMLKDIVSNPSERASDRIAAGNALLDRAYGKANQTNTNVNIDANGKATDISRKELTTRIEETLKRVEALTGGAPEKEPSQKRPADIRERDGDPGGSTFH